MVPATFAIVGTAEILSLRYDKPTIGLPLRLSYCCWDKFNAFVIHSYEFQAYHYLLVLDLFALFIEIIRSQQTLI